MRSQFLLRAVAVLAACGRSFGCMRSQFWLRAVAVLAACGRSFGCERRNFSRKAIILKQKKAVSKSIFARHCESCEERSSRSNPLKNSNPDCFA